MLKDCRILIIFCTCLGFSFGQDEWFPSEENCGRPSARTVRNQTGVFPSPLGSSPWHASIYKLPPGPSAEMILVCSGTIITKSHILTAASCVFINDCTLVDPDPFRVKVAHTSRSNDGPDVQQREVKHAKFDNYKGENFGYEYNVAILFLNEPLWLNDYVMPICIDWAGKTTFVPAVLEASGWGFNHAGGGSDALLDGVFATEVKCRRKQPTLRKYLTHDKFCLSTPQGREQEDTGTGLVYKLGDRYYLRGILSVMANQAYSPVTNATKFVKWFNYAVKRLDQERKCGNKFACVKGPCIEADQFCNGFPNCPDGSDESDPNCLEKCVGIVRVGIPPLVNKTHCVLPVQLGGSSYHLLNCDKDCVKQANTAVKVGSMVRLMCGQAATPSIPDPIYVCAEGTTQDGILSIERAWYPQVPLCQKSCRIQERKNTVPFHCETNRNLVKCETYLRPGTSVIYNCSKHYKIKEDSSGSLLSVTRVTCLENGKWSDQPPECIPQCGIGNTANLNVPTIAYGKRTKVGDFPWQVALYARENELQPWEQICGGTILLHPHIVLTAAHCLFWGITFATDQMKPSQTRVGAGKIFRDLEHREPPYQQEANVRKLIPHEEYVANQKGASLKNDIALVILERPFTLTDVVRPSCINYHYTAESLSVSRGKVAGWGYTEKNLKDGGGFGVPSDVLLYTDLSLHPNKECISLVKHKEIVTPDKFCGLYRNGSGPLKGDSGGGLVIYNRAPKVYDVIGIVSTKPSDSNEFGTFTSVGSHRYWLQAKIQLYENQIIFP